MLLSLFIIVHDHSLVSQFQILIGFNYKCRVKVWWPRKKSYCDTTMLNQIPEDL